VKLRESKEHGSSMGDPVFGGLWEQGSVSGTAWRPHDVVKGGEGPVSSSKFRYSSTRRAERNGDVVMVYPCAERYG